MHPSTIIIADFTHLHIKSISAKAGSGQPGPDRLFDLHLMKASKLWRLADLAAHLVVCSLSRALFMAIYNPRLPSVFRAIDGTTQKAFVMTETASTSASLRRTPSPT